MRGRSSPGAASLAIGLALAAAVTACQPTSGPPTDGFELAIPAPADSNEGVGPLTVVVRAPHGVLDGIGTVDPADVETLGAGNSVMAVPGRPDAIRVAWIGGECDDRIEMVLERVEEALRIRARTEQGLVLSCSAVGVLRAIELDLSAPVDPRRVVMLPAP